jgi:phytoene desaturase
MSHIDFKMGVFYPQGGIYALIEALERIGKKNGARFHVNAPVQRILVEQGRATGIELEDGTIDRADLVISNADIHFTEQRLLPPEGRDHDEAYWNSRVLAPSALILYLGLKKKVPTLTHHNLIFSQDWKRNFADIFDHPTWPEDPSYYVCAPSVTDPTVAPVGKENLFVLVPIATKLRATPEGLQNYRNKIIPSLEKRFGIEDLEGSIEFERLFCIDDFIGRYHSLGGSALGLAHTLKQTAIFRPKNQSKKVKGLYFVGGNTNPGIGMPMCLVSAELVYKRLTNDRSAGPLITL